MTCGQQVDNVLSQLRASGAPAHIEQLERAMWQYVASSVSFPGTNEEKGKKIQKKYLKFKRESSSLWPSCGWWSTYIATATYRHMLKFLHLFVVKRTPRNYDRRESGQWGTTHNMSVEIVFFKGYFLRPRSREGLVSSNRKPPPHSTAFRRTKAFLFLFLFFCIE